MLNKVYSYTNQKLVMWFEKKNYDTAGKVLFIYQKEVLSGCVSVHL